MSFVQDARTLLQDVVAPELRALSARFDAQDNLSSERHAALLDKLETLLREVALQMRPVAVPRKLEDLQEKAGHKQAPQ